MSKRNIFLLFWAYILIPVPFNVWLHTKSVALFYGSMQSVPLWGPMAMGGDILLTAFLLPLITWWVVPLFIKLQLIGGQAEPVTGEPENFLVRMFYNLEGMEAGARLGMLTVVLAGAPTALAMQFLGIHSLSYDQFMWFACTYTAVLTVFVSPFIAWVKLRKHSAIYA